MKLIFSKFLSPFPIFPPSRPFLDAYLLHPGLSDETRQWEGWELEFSENKWLTFEGSSTAIVIGNTQQMVLI